MTTISDQQTGEVPELDRRTALAASLRTLANLIEDIPDLPLMEPDIYWHILGSDEDARDLIARVADELTDEGLKFETTDDPDRGIGVTIPLVGGYQARAVHVYDRAMSAFYARASYESVIQLEVPEVSA